MAESQPFHSEVLQIDGEDIHFVHVRSPEPDATALMLSLARPSSFSEFQGLVGELTDPRAHAGDPADAFHVVIPSYPGVDGASWKSDWHPLRVAATFGELMARLGYDRYGVHGNDDGGALVAQEMSRLASDQVVGVHVLEHSIRDFFRKVI